MPDLLCGDIHVWRVRLDDGPPPLPPTAAESERAARFKLPHLGRRYLYAQAALRTILRKYTDAVLDFAVGEHGKPYLANARELQFNLSHSDEMALVAVAWNVEIGVDVERRRPMPDCVAVAERFFPPVDAAEFAEIPPADRERQFFVYWTRIEAMLKARGIGLYGAGTMPDCEWTLHPIDAGDGYVGAVVALRPGMSVSTFDFSAID